MPDTIRKTLMAETTVSAGRFTATISTDSIDRDGEVMVPQGMNSTDFERNPVVFWNHDYSMPVAKGLSLTRNDRSVVAVSEFASRPADFVGPFFPDFARALVEQGVVKGVSVGFMPMADGMRKATPADRDRYGDGVERVYSKWKLLEFSLAPLPANQDALISAVGKCCRAADVDRTKAMRWLGLDAAEEPVAEPVAEPVRVRRAIVVVPDVSFAPPDVEAMAEAAVSKAIARRKGRIFG